MRLLLVSLIALVAKTGLVQAGSHVWESSARDAHVHADDLSRRYFVINDDRSEGDRMPWPNRQIRYCFDTPEAKTALADLLKEAHKVWLRKGLGAEFTIVEVGDSECKNDKRFDTLLIQWSGDNGAMATFEGLPATDSVLRQATDPQVRPKMVLTTNLNMGMLDQVSNFAHELGHAWGLYHEHQNPAFWSRGTVSNALGGTVFGPENGGNWRCSNLKDYQSRVAGGGLVVQNPSTYPNQFGPRIGIDTLCKDYDFARKAQFSARDYLPMPKAMGIATSDGTSANDVDWDSIMICTFSHSTYSHSHSLVTDANVVLSDPSGAGAIGDASPGNDGRQPILLKPNGDRIAINLAPSQRDIAAMHKLYGTSKSTRSKILLQKAGGTVSDSFKNLFSKSSGHDGSSCL